MLRVSLCRVATGGETEEEKIRVDILENQTMDVRLHMARICYSPDFVSPLPLGWVAQSLNARQGPIYTGPFAIWTTWFFWSTKLVPTESPEWLSEPPEHKLQILIPTNLRKSPASPGWKFNS